MTTTSNKPSIYQKLLKIQQAVTQIINDKKKVGGGAEYEYSSDENIYDENIKPLMNELGLLLKQEVVTIENVRQDYTTNEGKDKSAILSTVYQRFTWIDCETGEIDVSLFATNGMNDWVMGVPSALSLAERYFPLYYFHIITKKNGNIQPEGNSGNYNKKAYEPKPNQKPIPANEKQFSLATQTKKRLELTPTNRPWWQQTIVWMQNGGSIEEFRKEYDISDFNAAILRKEALNAVA